jgi:hypothetical protein
LSSVHFWAPDKFLACSHTVAPSYLRERCTSKNLARNGVLDQVTDRGDVLGVGGLGAGGGGGGGFSGGSVALLQNGVGQGQQLARQIDNHPIGWAVHRRYLGANFFFVVVATSLAVLAVVAVRTAVILVFIIVVGFIVVVFIIFVVVIIFVVIIIFVVVIFVAACEKFPQAVARRTPPHTNRTTPTNLKTARKLRSRTVRADPVKMTKQ